jgi:subtilase family serine protease
LNRQEESMRNYRWNRRAITLAMVGSISITGAAFSASAQDLTYTANPPRAFVKSNGVAPNGIPACATNDPTSPTPGIIYCYTPGFIYTAYNILPVLQSGNFGQGQTIVIIDAFGSPTIAQDLATFHQVFFGSSFPAPDFQVICAAGCPNVNLKNKPQDEAGWTFETTLDVEWAHAIAPLAKIRLIVAPDPHGDSINLAIRYAVDHYPGSIVSQSFGTPEASFKGNNSHFKQAHQTYVDAVANGMTLLASSGDFGATNGNFSVANASYPASDPLVTGVGGTQGLPEGNLVLLAGQCAPPSTSSCTPVAYGAEAVWNEAFIASAGGGAVSTIFAPPSWQSALGFSGRAVPDVAYNAAVDGGVLIYYSAEGPAAAGFYIIGGTSAGSPQWAGIFALANTARAAASKGSIGFANAAIYAIAQGANYAVDFHDITAGNNILSGSTIGFAAHAGYDLATGWGTPNVANLVSDLAR